jgi:hypothetical protein
MLATISDVSDSNVIEFFSEGIQERWQFQDFCRNFPRNIEDF